MNINVCDGETAKLSPGTLDDRDFPNTAKPYLPGGGPAADLMFAYKVSRHCDGETIGPAPGAKRSSTGETRQIHQD
jgi:hypothetical protein